MYGCLIVVVANSIQFESVCVFVCWNDNARMQLSGTKWPNQMVVVDDFNL